MLSPQLLRILRSYWRLARPQRWLFPGRYEDRPLDPTVLHAACHSALDLGVDLPVQVHTVLGLTRVPNSASVMSSTWPPRDHGTSPARHGRPSDMNMRPLYQQHLSETEAAA
jgi:integrase